VLIYSAKSVKPKKKSYYKSNLTHNFQLYSNSLEGNKGYSNGSYTKYRNIYERQGRNTMLNNYRVISFNKKMATDRIPSNTHLDTSFGNLLSNNS